MIVIDSKRKKRENILKKYPDAIIADVTSHAEDQGKRIKLRCPPKVLTGTLHPSLPSIFSG